MRVRMKIHITGTRNGEDWPAKGDDIDLPDTEAADLIANGYAQLAEDLAVNGYAATIGDVAEALAAVDLSTLTIAGLKVLAAERGVDLGDAKKKDDIIAALELAQEEADAAKTPDPGDGSGSADGSDGTPTGTGTETGGQPGNGPDSDTGESGATPPS